MYIVNIIILEPYKMVTCAYFELTKAVLYQENIKQMQYHVSD